MTALSCSNCGEAHGADAVFCENCGFDFLTGSLPEPEAPVTSIGGPAAPPRHAATPTDSGIGVTLTVRVDPGHHERMDSEGALDLPEPIPDPVEIALQRDTVLLGRARPSKGLHPDVDLGSDPAVSSRHAVLERIDGRWTITDLGSMNGTYVGDSTVALTADTPVPVAPGTPIFLGAWTRLDLS